MRRLIFTLLIGLCPHAFAQSSAGVCFGYAQNSRIEIFRRFKTSPKTQRQGLMDELLQCGFTSDEADKWAGRLMEPDSLQTSYWRITGSPSKRPPYRDVAPLPLDFKLSEPVLDQDGKILLMTYNEATSYCQKQHSRLPTDGEWALFGVHHGALPIITTRDTEPDLDRPDDESGGYGFNYTILSDRDQWYGSTGYTPPSEYSGKYKVHFWAENTVNYYVEVYLYWQSYASAFDIVSGRFTYIPIWKVSSSSTPTRQETKNESKAAVRCLNIGN